MPEQGRELDRDADTEPGREPDVGPGREPGGAQRRHWRQTYTQQPDLYGDGPSTATVHAAAVFRVAGARDVLELGAGHAPDTRYFADRGFAVRTADFSPWGLEQTTGGQEKLGPAGSVDAVYAHMLLCRAMPTRDIQDLVGEVERVLRPGGTLVYTVRHTGDPHYGAGTAHGDGIFEHGGCAVHYFDRALVDALAEGWKLDQVHAVEEGDLPCRLWRVTQTLPRAGGR